MTTRRRSNRRVNPVPGDVSLALSDLGIDIVKINKDEAWALCPAHSERGASWSVNLDTGRHNCFSCGWHGNFLDLVEHVLGYEPERATDWIRTHGGYDAAKRRFTGESAWEKRDAEPVTAADLALFTDPPPWAMEDKDVTVESCRAYGVRWDPPNERWIFPIRDPYDFKLRGWQEKNKRIFLNKPDDVLKSDTLFGIDAFEGSIAYVMESPIDPVRMHSYGWRGAVGTFGVNLSDDQIRLIMEISRESIWALDNDEAGERISAQVKDIGLGRHRMKFFNYSQVDDKDPGTMHPTDIEWAVDNAIPAYLARFNARR